METSAREHKRIAVFGLRYTFPKDPAVPENSDIFSDTDLVQDKLSWIVSDCRGLVTFVSGGSRGVELITEEWCKDNRIDFVRVPPQTAIMDRFGVRNEQIIEQSDEILCFWDGRDEHVARVIRHATQRGKTVSIVPTIPN